LVHWPGCRKSMPGNQGGPQEPASLPELPGNPVRPGARATPIGTQHRSAPEQSSRSAVFSRIALDTGEMPCPIRPPLIRYAVSIRRRPAPWERRGRPFGHGSRPSPPLPSCSHWHSDTTGAIWRTITFGRRRRLDRRPVQRRLRLRLGRVMRTAQAQLRRQFRPAINSRARSRPSLARRIVSFPPGKRVERTLTCVSSTTCPTPASCRASSPASRPSSPAASPAPARGACA
jgi:hypothetical protein